MLKIKKFQSDLVFLQHHIYMIFETFECGQDPPKVCPLSRAPWGLFYVIPDPQGAKPQGDKYLNLA